MIRKDTSQNLNTTDNNQSINTIPPHILNDAIEQYFVIRAEVKQLATQVRNLIDKELERLLIDKEQRNSNEIQGRIILARKTMEEILILIKDKSFNDKYPEILPQNSSKIIQLKKKIVLKKLELIAHKKAYEDKAVARISQSTISPIQEFQPTQNNYLNYVYDLWTSFQSSHS